jgi:hypothetical protein
MTRAPACAMSSATLDAIADFPSFGAKPITLLDLAAPLLRSTASLMERGIEYRPNIQLASNDSFLAIEAITKIGENPYRNKYYEQYRLTGRADGTRSIMLVFTPGDLSLLKISIISEHYYR